MKIACFRSGFKDEINYLDGFIPYEGFHTISFASVFKAIHLLSTKR